MINRLMLTSIEFTKNDTVLIAGDAQTLPDINAFVATPVIGIGDLRSGEAAHGPALIEQAGSTIVVGPGDTYMLDAFGNVRISVGARRGQSA